MKKHIFLPTFLPLIVACSSVEHPASEANTATSSIGQKAHNTQPASASHEGAMQALIHRAEQERKDEAGQQAERPFITNGTEWWHTLNSQAPTPSGPRKIFVGARSSDPVLAAYLDRWRQTLEKVGNAHYPKQAKQQNLFGSVQATIEIDSKGRLLKIEINRSSGHRQLDDAVSNIMKRAAPFEPLPPEISQKADIVSITRTWIFTTTEALKAKTKEAVGLSAFGKQETDLVTLPATDSKYPPPSAER